MTDNVTSAVVDQIVRQQEEIERLKAELEALKGQRVPQYDLELLEARLLVDSLKAENERLKAALAEYERTEPLKKRERKGLVDRLRDLDAENNRLKSLLLAGTIVEGGKEPNLEPYGCHKQVARWLEAGKYRKLLHRNDGTFVAADESKNKMMRADTLPLLADALMNWPQDAENGLAHMRSIVEGGK